MAFETSVETPLFIQFVSDSQTECGTLVADGSVTLLARS
jgi:hypothetical protein